MAKMPENISGLINNSEAKNRRSSATEPLRFFYALFLRITVLYGAVDQIVKNCHAPYRGEDQPEDYAVDDRSDTQLFQFIFAQVCSDEKKSGDHHIFGNIFDHAA